MRGKWNKKCIICMLPGISGTLIFFVIPYLRMLYYSVIDNQSRRNFTGLCNYIETVKNRYFILAFKNSLIFIAAGVPVLVVFAVVISILLYFGNISSKKGVINLCIKSAFILPMLLPTAALSVVWREIFEGASTAFPVYILFWWKNTGICIILLTASFAAMDKEVFEAAVVDGVTNIKKHIYITIPMNIPVIIFTALLSIVNSFRIFKESCLFYGSSYPPDYSYTLQYYMNNHFYKLDYQVLSSAAVLLSLFVMLIIIFCLEMQKKYQV